MKRFENRSNLWRKHRNISCDRTRVDAVPQHHSNAACFTFVPWLPSQGGNEGSGELAMLKLPRASSARPTLAMIEGFQVSWYYSLGVRWNDHYLWLGRLTSNPVARLFLFPRQAGH